MFAAVVPDKMEIDCLTPFINQLKREEWGSNVRWIKPENIHLTLRFFGDTDENKYRCLLDAMRPVIEDTPSFDIVLSKVICLPSVSKARVIAAGISPQETLTYLAAHTEKVARNCGYDAEKKRFLGHFTIGRCKNLDLRSSIIPQNADGLQITVKAVELVRSILSPSGSEYKTIANIPLKS
jgi:2'-5' RNA ligase